MSYYTDESTLPTSTLDSGSNSSSSSAPSVLDVEIKNLDFLNNSWPFLDRLGDARFSETALTSDDVDFNSWNFGQGFPGMRRYQPQELDMSGASSGIFAKQRSSCSARQTNGSPSSLNSSGCSPDASLLYNTHGKHYNPSGSGHHASHQLEEYTHWINNYLQYSSHSDYVTDLTESLADGQTLLYLVEILLDITIRPVHVKPALDVQKTENIDMCLDVLKRHGVPVDDVDTEDIVNENTKAVLVLCQCLHKHFGSSPGSTRTASPQANHRTISPRSISPVVRPSTDERRGWHTSSPIEPRPSKKSPIDVDDIALLEWVANLTGQKLDGYESFQDGHVLCLLINQLTDGAVPDVVLQYGIPSEKISLALTFSRDELEVATNLNPEDILNLTDTTKLSLYLKTLHKIFLEQKVQERNYLKMKETVGLMKQAKKLKEMKNISTKECMDNERTNRNATERHPTSKMDKKDSRFSTKNSSSDSYLPMVKDSKQKDMFSATSMDRNNDITLPQCRTVADKKSPKSRMKTRDFPKDERHYSLEEIKNLENDYRSTSTFSPLCLNHEDSEECPLKLTTHKKLGPKSTLDEHVVLDLIPRETYVFGTENWKSSFEPLAPSKSWRKEREKAKTKLDFFNQQLMLLKEEYFKYMNIELMSSEGNESSKSDGEETEQPQDNTIHLSSNKTTESRQIETAEKFPSRMLDKHFTKPEHSRSNYTCKMLSESFNGYFGKNNGTTPPYRTWSKYLNTDGDRYKLYSKKKKEMRINKPRTDLNHDHVNSSPSDVTGGVLRNKLKNQETSNREDCPSISPQIKKIQETRSERCLSDDGISVSSTGSQEDSGHRFYGITALVRLSSKKANATSDTES